MTKHALDLLSEACEIAYNFLKLWLKNYIIFKQSVSYLTENIESSTQE